MNSVHLIGYIGNAPEIKETEATVYARLSLAVTTSFNNDGTRKERTDWFPIAAFGALAKSLHPLKTGARIAVEGRLRTNTYTKDGEKRTSIEVIARSIEFLTREGRSAAADPEAFDDSEPVDDETPF